MILQNRKFTLDVQESEIRRLIHMSHYYIRSEECFAAYETFEDYARGENEGLSLLSQLCQLIGSPIYNQVMSEASQLYNRDGDEDIQESQ